MSAEKRTIVFYDGECGFCNWVVSFILKAERGKDICFASLQSPFAKKFFHDNGAPEPDLSTFYLYWNHQLFSRSTAAIGLLHFLKWPYKVLNIFRVIPVCQRDQLYNSIAKRRQCIMKGKCYVPTAEQRKRFLNEIGD
jgi:predicted DCC family thiol-disulfide oxidoreductase YuxK